MDLTVVNLFFAGSGVGLYGGVRWVFAGIFGWCSCLFAREEFGGCSEGCSFARKDLWILISVSQFPLSVIAMFVLVSSLV